VYFAHQPHAPVRLLSSTGATVATELAAAMDPTISFKDARRAPRMGPGKIGLKGRAGVGMPEASPISASTAGRLSNHTRRASLIVPRSPSKPAAGLVPSWRVKEGASRSASDYRILRLPTTRLLPSALGADFTMIGLRVPLTG